MNYDIDLFLALNEEYKDKPIAPKPRKLDPAAQKAEGSSRAHRLADIFAGVTPVKLAGKRVLEIGCGRGNTSREVADALGCKVIGVDITAYPQWMDNQGSGVELHKLDISTQDCSRLGQFDFAYSFSVWEHMHHPHGALKAMRQLLAPGGVFYLSANLHRGPRASHRYREVFFPWPHLLFEDSVFEEFYRRLGKPPARPAWVNKLVSAEYLLYFQELGFNPRKVTYSKLPFDTDFYSRFEEILGRYPRFDLERDFINAVLTVDA